MGINVRIQKSPKPINVIIAQVEFERDLASCMRCRFFYGNNRQCIAKRCVKEEKELLAAVTEHTCAGCPYSQSEKYCFPCMRKILGEMDHEQIRKRYNQADGGT